MKILLLEDDPTLLEILDEYLRERGDDVRSVTDGFEAEEIASKEPFDLLLLDVNVPYLNGFEFLKNLRDLGDDTPAIFITSLNSSKDLKFGFEVGANDYIKKPFDFDELEARIGNIKKKMPKDIEIDNERFFCSQTNSIKIGMDIIEIRQKESELLLYMLKNRGKILSSEAIIGDVWRYDEIPTESTLRTYIKNLRKILGEECIKNIRGVGYLFK